MHDKSPLKNSKASLQKKNKIHYTYTFLTFLDNPKSCNLFGKERVVVYAPYFITEKPIVSNAKASYRLSYISISMSMITTSMTIRRWTHYAKGLVIPWRVRFRGNCEEERYNAPIHGCTCVRLCNLLLRDMQECRSIWLVRWGLRTGFAMISYSFYKALYSVGALFFLYVRFDVWRFNFSTKVINETFFFFWNFIHLKVKWQR